MKKSSLLFWLDILLFLLLVINILTVIPEIATHSYVHVIFGILLTAGAIVHIGLHWKWIRNAFVHFMRLPGQMRSNVYLDLALFCLYIVCGGMGLIARSLLTILPLHIFLGVIHVLLAVVLVSLQIIHLDRHWKWITVTTHRIIKSSST